MLLFCSELLKGFEVWNILVLAVVEVVFKEEFWVKGFVVGLFWVLKGLKVIEEDVLVFPPTKGLVFVLVWFWLVEKGDTPVVVLGLLINEKGLLTFVVEELLKGFVLVDNPLFVVFWLFIPNEILAAVLELKGLLVSPLVLVVLVIVWLLEKGKVEVEGVLDESELALTNGLFTKVLVGGFDVDVFEEKNGLMEDVVELVLVFEERKGLITLLFVVEDWFEKMFVFWLVNGLFNI